MYQVPGAVPGVVPRRTPSPNRPTAVRVTAADPGKLGPATDSQPEAKHVPSGGQASTPAGGATTVLRL